jgi:hypothetical protein
MITTVPAQDLAAPAGRQGWRRLESSCEQLPALGLQPALARANSFDPTNPPVLVPTLGQASDREGSPHVVVLPDGTTVAQWWHVTASQQSDLQVCRIPLGATACAGAPQTIVGSDGGGPVPETGLLQSDVNNDPQRLVSVYSRNVAGQFAVFASTSTDGGQTFSPPVQTGQPSGQSPDFRVFARRARRLLRGERRADRQSARQRQRHDPLPALRRPRRHSPSDRARRERGRADGGAGRRELPRAGGRSRLAGRATPPFRPSTPAE